MTIEHHAVEPSACARCGLVLAHATPVYSDAKPVPGGVTLCIRCGALHVFQEDMTLRRLFEIPPGAAREDRIKLARAWALILARVFVERARNAEKDPAR